MGCRNSFASVIEEKDVALAHHDDQIEAFKCTNEEHQQQILTLNEESNDLIANKRVARR